MELIEQMMTGVASLPREQARSAILALQAHIQSMPEALPPESCPVRHLFAPGCYAREMTMPEGMLVIGKIHKHAHLNVLSAGRIRVLSEFGCAELVAPCTFVSEPGIKRVGLVLENAVWTTFHVTESTDLEEIEREHIAEEYSELDILGSATDITEVQECLGSWSEQQP